MQITPNHFFLFVAAFIAFAALHYCYELFTIAKIEKYGKKTQGKLVRKFMRRQKNSRTYYFEVEFSNGLRTIDTKYKVTENAYAEAKEGMALPVIYLESNPKKCHHPDYVSATWNMMALKGLWFLFVLALIVGMNYYKTIDPDGTWIKSFTHRENEE